MKIFKTKKRIITVSIILAAIAILFGQAFIKVFGRTQLEFDIQQNQELILFSDYAEPPQFAIWLENPETKQLKTIFATHRSAQGDWDGKVECPGSLPLWFEVFKREYQVNNLPGTKKSIPIAITGATPQVGHFKIRAEVPSGSKWICWIEVNLAGDYNEYFNNISGNPIALIDESGQPSIVYKAVIISQKGSEIEPEIVGCVDITKDFTEMIQPLDDVTTAKDIFKEIKIKVIKPKPSLFKWSYKYLYCVPVKNQSAVQIYPADEP
jgi:hypothetical protein